jgi:hypothetical protein
VATRIELPEAAFSRVSVFHGSFRQLLEHHIAPHFHFSHAEMGEINSVFNYQHLTEILAASLTQASLESALVCPHSNTILAGA